MLAYETIDVDKISLYESELRSNQGSVFRGGERDFMDSSFGEDMMNNSASPQIYKRVGRVGTSEIKVKKFGSMTELPLEWRKKEMIKW